MTSSPAFDIPSFLKALTTRPGVYRMLDGAGAILYVGKAKNLKNRVSSYFKSNHDSPKTRALVERIVSIEVTITHSETEALLLEQTLIKQLRPPYNIVLRDDKSYPFIFLAEDHEFPRLAFHRGSKSRKGQYFGPYPSSAAVRETLNLLQKIFRVRQCEDTFYRNRSRPCLQYQINRCSGPCVGLVDAQSYNDDVELTRLFLQGKSAQLTDLLIKKMEEASANLEFEKAAEVRDQLVSVRRIQESQDVEGENGNVDVVAIHQESSTVCVQILFVRDGRVLGSKSFFPKIKADLKIDEILESFLAQYYLDSSGLREVPAEILSNEAFDGQQALAELLTEQIGRKVRVDQKVRGVRAAWMKLAVTNAQQQLVSYMANKQNLLQRFEALREALELEEIPKRLECFDISHTQGEGTVASCVVFDQNGPKKNDYRRFNIEGITGGDDYAAMAQAIERRYTRLKRGEGKLPDILFIDGGKGQVGSVKKVLEELQVTDVMVIGVAKGVSRKPGLETLIDIDNQEIFVESSSPALHLIQHIRDEAHRFAITGHRARRDKKRKESPLEGIPGIGPKKRKQLLSHFGGMQELRRASEKDFAAVAGISEKLAKDLYAALHQEI